MADVLKLKRSSTELNLLAAEGAGLREQKWFPKMADILYSGIPPYLTEAMDVLIDRTAHDDLATSMQALDQMRHWAAMYRTVAAIREPVWLHAKMNGETGERRAYIRSLTGEWRSDQIGPSGHPAAYDALVQLQMERHPYWEALSHTTGTSDTGVTGASIKHDYGSVAGDVGARVAKLIIESEAGSGGVDRLWAGLRGSELGTPGSFAHLWECELATAWTGADTSVPQADATASPGSGNTKRTVSFATTPGWAKRLQIRAEQVTNYEHTLGRLFWLFRAKIDAGTECKVGLKWGFTGIADDDMLEGPIPVVDNSSWDYYEMGEFDNPPINMKLDSGLFTTTNLAAKAQIQIWAERTSGTGSLHMDCLCPIPLSEGWLIVKDITIGAGSNEFTFAMSPSEEVIVFGNQGVYIENWPVPSYENFYFPPGAGRLVFVGARSNSSDLTDTFAIYPYYYPRWVNLRGSE